jgi:hypothetical protein
MRPPRFSIANLLALIAMSAVLFAFPRWFGWDATMLAAPYCGVIAGRLLTRTRSGSPRLRWLVGTFAGGMVTIAVCLSDPRAHDRTAFDHIVGIPACFLYGLTATAVLEGLSQADQTVPTDDPNSR